MRHVCRVAIFLLASVALVGCQTASTATAPADQSAVVAVAPLDQLQAGNQRFVAGHPLHANQSIDRRTELTAGQYPIAIVVGCSDSRVPPELVFDQGLGDIFVVRVAGNIMDDHALGSIEYAVEHLHATLIVVLGHDKCGAVAAAVAGDTAPGHIQSIVTTLQPAVKEAKSHPGDLLDNAIDANIRIGVYELQNSDPILAHEVQAGHLKIVGARYSLATGAVRFFPN